MEGLRKGGFGSHLASLAAALLASVGAAFLLLYAFSSSFGEALGLFFLGPFQNAYYFGNMLGAASGLALVGLAAQFAFSARTFNLGGEGQLYLGAIAATAACLALPEESGLLGKAIGLAAGSAAGALLGALSGFLRRRLGVDELLSSFLLSSALVYAGDFLVSGPLQDPASNFQTSPAVPEGLRFARLLPPSSLSTAALLALAALAAAWFILGRTRFGFELRLSGKNAEFARYCGIDAGRYAAASLAISGALNGLAGAALILGTYNKAMKGFSAGLGWTGIAVALVAGGSPLALLPAALFFAYLDAGAKAVMIGADVTSEIVGVIQAIVFFLVTARALDSLVARRAAARAGRAAGGRG